MSTNGATEPPISTPNTSPDAPLEAVAFDLDGLLVNSEDIYIHVGSETLRRRGKVFEDDLRHAMMGQPAAAALRVMIDWHGLSDTVEALIAESEELFWRFATDGLRLMPGVTSLLDWLDEKSVRRGIATSGGRGYAERVLGITGLAGRFSFVVTADDVTRGKPEPEPYLQAAERLGVAPERMMVLEDSAIGCRAGVASGAYTVAVPNHHTVDHDFPAVPLRADTLADPRIRTTLAP